MRPAEQGERRLEVAAELATRQIPVVEIGSAAAEVRNLLTKQRFESVSDVVVMKEGRLAGLARIEDVLSAPDGMTVEDLMDDDPPVVAPGIDQEVAAWHMVQHGESSLAVIDSDGEFVGLVPPSRLLSVLLWEHDEDMARLGGFMRDTSAARTASEEPVARRFWHRLPWLMLGLMGALVAANIVASFEAELERTVAIAFFIPGIVYLADAVGTQTEAIVIRGLSVGVNIRRVVWREVATGVSVGIALSLAFFPLALLLWGQMDVAAAVSLALLAACSIATVIALLLPYMFSRLGVDPAFGSGPLATVVQDILSITIYLTIAMALV